MRRRGYQYFIGCDLKKIFFYKMSSKKKLPTKKIIQGCQKQNFHNTKLPNKDITVNKKIDDYKVNTPKPPLQIRQK